VYEVNRRSVANYSQEDSYVSRLMRNVYTVRAANGTYQYLTPQNGGRLATENRQGDFWTARAQVDFTRTIAGKHDVVFLAGLEFRETNAKGTRNLFLGWDDQLQSHSTTSVDFNALWLINNTSWYAAPYPARQFVYTPLIRDVIGPIVETRTRNGSGYANFTYTYDNRFNVFGSLRKDYADVYGLATEFRGSPFWSVGASWNLHNEEFIKGINKVNILKLRTSYGFTGNIYEGATSYMTATTGQTNSYTGQPRATIESPGNPELSWERTGTINIGVEFMLFDHRLRGVFDWYNKKSDKLFSRKTLETTKGFTSLIMNLADMKNNGVELTLAYDWFRAKSQNGFSWTTSATGSYNKNEITYVETQYSTAYSVINGRFMKGYPISAMFSYRFAGLTEKGSQSWYAENGNIIPGVNIQNNTPGSVYYSGQADPKYTFAVENQWKWNGFSLNMMLVYYGGHHLRANQIQMSWNPTDAPVRSWYIDAWTPTNTNTIVPGIWQHDAGEGSQPAVQNATDIFVHPADFLKIRNLVFGYDLPRGMVSKIGFNSLSLRFQIDNLPTVWMKNSIGFDPERVVVQAPNVVAGVTLPTCYIFGLNFRF